MKFPDLLLSFAFLVSSSQLVAQPGYEILKDVKKIEIPFEYKQNLILVNVVFDRTFPLKFIFDTGAENTILAKRSITDLLGVPYEREFKVLGSDMKTMLTAYLVRGIHLKIGDMVAPNQSMLVLDEDYFNFEEMLGFQVHGILGADNFRGLIVKIDYEKQVITLTKSEATKEKYKGYQMLPIVVEKNKPYLKTIVKTQSDTLVNVKLLLDTGAMLSLLLNTDSHPGLKAPANSVSGNIGTGLGGFLFGHLGRVSLLSLGELQCSEVITNFQDLEVGMDTALMQGRNGVIGNGVLSRFDVVIDYPHERLYLLPNKHYQEEFNFDKSGLAVIASDPMLNKFVVHSVIAGSPADLAGVQAGDVIRWINYSPASMLSLERITQIFQRKEGKEIRLAVNRNGIKYKFRFKLKKLI
jgi:hypothetical protein